MINELLNKLSLPPLLSKEEMIKIMQSEEYGFIPPAPEKISFEVEENTIPRFCAGKAPCNKITAHCTLNGKEFSFPFWSVIPVGKKNLPFFVHINFRPDIPDRYMPTEELIDNGFAVFSFCYKDVTSDDEDFTDGLAGILFDNGKRNDTDPGKIAMWAWASHRVLDYAETLGDTLDFGTSVVCGHSRLGKTSLFAAATDSRFAFAHSNDSGCSGDSITRDKRGETVEDICRKFPFWFCENYKKYINNEHGMPFDQHFLIACIAPRNVSVGSAEQDIWADPYAEFLCCAAASPAFEKGFIHGNRLPEPGDEYLEGDVGFYMRSGQHYFSREDWLKMIKFIKLHKN